MTRVDDVINTAGHRISTGRLEEVINEVESVVESAVIGFDDKRRMSFSICRAKRVRLIQLNIS